MNTYSHDEEDETKHPNAQDKPPENITDDDSKSSACSTHFDSAIVDSIRDLLKEVGDLENLPRFTPEEQDVLNRFQSHLEALRNGQLPKRDL